MSTLFRIGNRSSRLHFREPFGRHLGQRSYGYILSPVDILSVREDYSELKGYVQRLREMEFQKASTYTRVCLYRQLSFEY